MDKYQAPRIPSLAEGNRRGWCCFFLWRPVFWRALAAVANPSQGDCRNPVYRSLIPQTINKAAQGGSHQCFSTILHSFIPEADWIKLLLISPLDTIWSIFTALTGEWNRMRGRAMFGGISNKWIGLVDFVYLNFMSIDLTIPISERRLLLGLEARVDSTQVISLWPDGDNMPLFP